MDPSAIPSNRIKKYVCTLVSVEGQPDMDDTGAWKGKLKKLEDIFRCDPLIVVIPYGRACSPFLNMRLVNTTFL